MSKKVLFELKFDDKQGGSDHYIIYDNGTYDAAGDVVNSKWKWENGDFHYSHGADGEWYCARQTDCILFIEAFRNAMHKIAEDHLLEKEK